MVNRKCTLCNNHFLGRVNDRFGVYAHINCVKDKLTYLEWQYCPTARDLIISHLPNERLQFNGGFSHCVWSQRHPAIPANMTLSYFLSTHEDEVLDAIKRHNEATALGTLSIRTASVAKRKAADAARDSFKEKFHEACIERNAPFRSVHGLRKQLCAPLFNLINVPRPEEMVRRAMFAIQHRNAVPDLLRRYVFEECDVTSVQLVTSYANRIDTIAWRYAFRAGSDPRQWVDMAINVKDVQLIPDALKQGFNAARVVRATHEFAADMEYVLSSQINMAASLEDFETRLQHLKTLPLEHADVRHMVTWRSDIVGIAASYKRAMECAGENAYTRFGGKCFELRGEHSAAQDLDTLMRA
ncbi:hypothetical protein JKP88DRAFT_290126 [Tribonema minus]|uniref:Uncharacterized protein n=1 Tax=Tribonema minus TaxID=303371 RepID=A0A835Z028_9STRA|nr:hypothetical protein JKP88DRAFT_290126 [Tribonema minus]